MAESEVRVVEQPNLKQKKKQRKQATPLDHFARLTSEDAKSRVKGGALLVKHLTLGEAKSEELKHALSRLVRGVGATRNSSRAGFYSALTVLLRNGVAELGVDDVLGVVEKELHTSGNNSKSENADILTGHVLVCGALLRSEFFGAASGEKQKKVVEMLLNAGKKRSYLSLPAYVFIVDSLNTMSPELFREGILPVLKPEVTKPLGDFTLDNLYFLAEAKEKFPEIVNKSFFKATIGASDLIIEDNLADITQVLMNVLPIKQILKHPVYKTIGKLLSLTEHVPAFLAHINGALLKPTHMRHVVAATILTQLAENCDKSVLPEIFTPNFLQHTLTHFKMLDPRAKNEDDLRFEVYRLLEATVQALKGEDVKNKAKLGVMKRLIFNPGSFIFEKITGSKVLQQITALLNAEGVKKLCKSYRRVLLGVKEEGEREWVNLDRTYASQLIVKLLGHPSVKTEMEWKTEQLKLLMEVGFIKAEDSNIGTELATTLKETFYRAIDLKLPKLEDLRKILSELVHHLDAQFSEETYPAILRMAFTPESFALWKRGLEAIDKLEAKTKKSHLNPVFHILFLHMSLQLFNEAKLAADSLNELFSCYERVKKEKKQTEGDIKWIEVVIDLFLNLLSHNSHLLRSLTNCVFPHLCKHLTPTALQQILSVLDPKCESPLSGDEDSTDEENDSDSDKEESESEDDSGNESLEETVNDKLRQAVREALGGAQSDDESVDLDALNEEDCEKLNETLGAAFKRFKPNIGRTNKKKQSKDQETLTHFRVRVLDLLNVYLESPDVNMLYTLEIMVPLLQTLEFCVKDHHQKPLQDRVRATFRRLIGLKKFASVEGVAEDTLSDLLQSLLEKGTKTSLIVQEIGDSISTCTIYIIKCAQFITGLEETPKKLKKKLKNRILDILRDALNVFFLKRDCLTPYVLFKDLMKLGWTPIAELLCDLENHAFNENVRPFRRNQALELLKLSYTNHRMLSNVTDKLTVHFNGVETNLYNHTLELLEKPGNNAKDKFIYILFSLLNAIRNSPVKTTAINWEKIGEVIREYRSGVSLSKDAKGAFTNLCRSLKISHVVKMKPTVVTLTAGGDDEKEGEKEVNGTKKDKKKKGKVAHKLKKETQALRMESLSVGLSAALPFTDMAEEKDDSDSGSNKRKHEEISETKQNGINGGEEKLNKSKKLKRAKQDKSKT